MEISKIKVQNLMSGKLETLLAEIESQVKNKNFADLDKCVAELAKIGEHLVIKTNAEGKKVATVEAKDGDVTEQIDFMEVLEKLKEKFDTRTATKRSERPAMKAYRDNVEKTIGTLLKENEITQELVSRGISDRDIIDNGESEIQRSTAKVDKLKPRLEEVEQTRALFGEDSYIETAKKWDSKSYITQIKDANIAKKKLDEIKAKLTEMKDYAEDLGKLDPADKAANEAEIAKILAEVKELKGEISDLQISGLDLKELDHINEHNAGNISAKITEVDNMITSSTTSKTNAMAQMRTIIENNPDKFTAYIPSGVAPASLTEKQLQEIADKLDKDIKMYATEIRYEETYQAKTRESVDRYKEAAERARDIGAKFQEVPVMKEVKKFEIRSALEMVTNDDGTVTVAEKTDADGNVLKAIYEFDETAGDYVVVKEFTEHLEGEDLDNAVKDEIGDDWENETLMVDSGRTELVATDATRQEALRTSGIADENAYIEQAKNSARTAEETAIATLSRADKRRLIREAYRANGGFHPIKFLRSQFAPSSMWENEYKSAYLSPRVAVAEAEATQTAKAELDSRVQSAVATDLDELRNSTSIVRVARKYASEELAKAASRNRVLYNVEQKTDVDSIKQSAVRAAVVTGLSAADLYIQYLDGQITPEDFNRQMESFKSKKDSIQARAYTDDVRNPQQYARGHKDTFEDGKEDGEER